MKPLFIAMLMISSLLAYGTNITPDDVRLEYFKAILQAHALGQLVSSPDLVDAVDNFELHVAPSLPVDNLIAISSYLNSTLGFELYKTYLMEDFDRMIISRGDGTNLDPRQ